MAVAAAQKNREMFAIKKSYSIEVSTVEKFFRKFLVSLGFRRKVRSTCPCSRVSGYLLNGSFANVLSWVIAGARGEVSG